MAKEKRLLRLAAFFFLAWGIISLSMGLYAVPESPLLYTIKVKDTVTAGTATHIARGLEIAGENRADAVIIWIDTPGGLVSATLDIIKSISVSKVPVITFVAPEGAIAASAGTFILISGHIAAMAPGTTCGAAMPVNISAPGVQQAADQKTINFLAGHMKSVARQRERPEDIAEQFVKKNLTLTAAEALERNVIDLSAKNLEQLLNRLDGMEVTTDAGIKVINTSGATVTELPMNNSEKLINILSNPTLAAVFLILGIYGLIIGYSSPGFFLPEIMGAILIILGLYGSGLFQVNLAAALLGLLGIGLLIGEALTPTYGVLGIGGVIAIVLGILLFPVEPLMPQGWFAGFKVMAFGVGGLGAILMLLIVVGMLRVRRLKTAQGDSEFIDAPAVVVKDINPRGQVKIKGEIWAAISRDKGIINRGETVRVIERRGLTLIVERPREIE